MLRDNEGLVPGVKCPARAEELGQVNKEDPLLIEDLRWVTEDRGEDLSAAIDEKWVRMVAKHLWVKPQQGLARCNQTKVWVKSNPVLGAARNFARR